MSKQFVRRVGVIAVGAVMLATAGATNASASDRIPSIDAAAAARANAQISGYEAQHPGDLAGLEAIHRKLTGKGLVVTMNGVPGQLTGAQAQKILDARKAAEKTSDVGIFGYPRFTVALYQASVMGPPPTLKFSGYWDFPDQWAGQAAPLDITDLAFQVPNCVHLGLLGSRTYSVDNKSTNLGHLEKANGTAPIFGIKDHTVAFGNQADHGYIDVNVSNYCGVHQRDLVAAFDYEGNQGGSVVGFSASIFGLSVSYGSEGLRGQEGTPNQYFEL